MLALETKLRRNEEEVAAKVMDGEAILINLSNGMYYSMDKVGGALWSMVEEGYSLGEIATALAEEYQISLEQARADVERLAQELLREALVVVSDQETSAVRTPRPRPEAKLPYDPPALNVYSDMGDLLALDPPVPGLDDISWKE